MATAAPRTRGRVAMNMDRDEYDATSSAASVASAAMDDAASGAAKMRNSLPVFRRYLSKVGSNGNIVASEVISRECFLDWVATRGSYLSLSEAEKTFQRTLTAHVTGSDGRQCFSPEEEAAVLVVLRQKRAWPAFSDSGSTIGCKGFRSFGFHEKQRSSQVPVALVQRVQPAKHSSSAKRRKSLKRTMDVISVPRSPRVQRPQSREVVNNNKNNNNGGGDWFEDFSGMLESPTSAKRWQLSKGHHSASEPEQWAPNGSSGAFISPLVPMATLNDDWFDDLDLVITPSLSVTPPPPPASPVPESDSAPTLQSTITVDPLVAQQDETEVFFSKVLRSLEPAVTTGPPSAYPMTFEARQIKAEMALGQCSSPTTAVLIANLHATDFDTLFLAQNLQSIAIIGSVIRGNGGQFRPLVAQSELISVFRHVWYCLNNPERPVTMTIPLDLASGETVSKRVMVQSLGDGLVQFSVDL